MLDQDDPRRFHHVDLRFWTWLILPHSSLTATIGASSLGGGPLNVLREINGSVGPRMRQFSVELTINSLPPNSPFEQVKFGEDLKRKAIVKLSRFQKVVIPD